MSKITRISLTNFKAISDLTMDFNGCTALITGKNNSGKSSFLRGIIDRIRFIRPDIMVRQGQKEGKGELVLDTGEKFVWEFDTEKKDKLTYITDQGRKSVTRELAEQFFKPVFDIDKFLQSSPKQQVKQLQAIVGINFDEIDKRYEEAYNIRTQRNREAEIYHVKLEKMMKVDAVKPVDVTKLKEQKEIEKNKLNALYLKNKESNQKKRALWEEAKGVVDRDCAIHNGEQEILKNVFNACFQAMLVLRSNGFEGGEDFIDSLREKFKPEMVATDLYAKEPEYIEERPDSTELEKIDEQLLKAAETNAQAQKYQEYQDYKMETEAAKDAADLAHGVVVNIEMERQRMINSAKFPEGISISDDGITVDGFPLNKDQISTSKLYCSALRIASMNLGEVKSLYFDASFLDKITLAEICEWAEKEGYQLLIERPDWEGKDISYELIEG